MFYQLAYVSRSTQVLSTDQLPALMRTTRRENLISDLTGLLLVEWPVFLHVLEGTQTALRDHLDAVYADPRYQDIGIICQQSPVVDREFGRWRMLEGIFGNRTAEEFAKLDDRVKGALRRGSADGFLAQQLLADFQSLDRISVGL